MTKVIEDYTTESEAINAYYDLSCESFEKNDLEEASKYVKKGLKLVKSSKDEVWKGAFLELRKNINLKLSTANNESPNGNDLESLKEDFSKLALEDTKGNGYFQVPKSVVALNQSKNKYSQQGRKNRNSVPSKKGEVVGTTEKLNAKTYFKEELIEGKLFTQLKVLVKKILINEGYHIISRKKGLGKRVYKELDLTKLSYVAIKTIEISSKKRLCLILPIKITPLKGILIVSEKSVKYKPSGNNYDLNPSIKNAFVAPINNNTSKSQDILFKSLITEGFMFRYLRNFLRNDFYTEKTILKKPLFFRDGDYQYRVIINPIFVSKTNVEFVEKSIPFAYQKKLNLFGVSVAKFDVLLDYLETKYFLIETERIRPTSIEMRESSKERLGSHLRSISAPFLSLGIGTLVVMAFNLSFMYDLLYQLGAASIAILFVVLFFLYLKHFHRTTKIKKEFKTPYFKTQFSFDEAELLSIKENLNEALINQFIYEYCDPEELEDSIFSNEYRLQSNKMKRKKANRYEEVDDTIDEDEFDAKEEISNLKKLNNEAKKLENSRDKPNNKLRKNISDKHKSFIED